MRIYRLSLFPLPAKAYFLLHAYSQRLAVLLLAGGLLAVPQGRVQGADSTDSTTTATTTRIPGDTSIPGADLNWISTWAGSPSSDANFAFAGSAYNGNNTFNNQTVRLIVHASLGGSRVRVRLSNELSGAPLRIGAAHIALSAGGASIAVGSDRTLTFSGGEGSVMIPAGAPVLSDPVKLDVPALADLTVTLFLPDNVTVTTAVVTSKQTNYVAPAASGDNTGAVTLPLDPTAPTITQWPILTRVDVRDAGAQVFVALGSSITLGYLTTQDANARWTDVLAKRLNKKFLPVSVVNSSIIANRLLANGAGLGALARLDRDVFSQPGVGYVFINDILGVESQVATSPVDIIAGLRQIVERAHGHNIKVYAGTILPLGGSSNYSPQFEINRQTVNTFIRTAGIVDGVVDFDAALSDPANPAYILEIYDGGDHHHPNDLGNKKMAQAFALTLFQ